MKEKLFAVSLGVLALALGPACVVSADEPGNITVGWSFNGQSCSQETLIESVQIVIPGEALDNNGFYPCSVNGVDGIVLHDFAPGRYDFSIDAIDYDGTVSYSGGGSFVVDGDVFVRVDLSPNF